jgi:hypothetical protein
MMTLGFAGLGFKDYRQKLKPASGSVRAAAERATEARKEADRLACKAWNKRMLGFQGPAQPSPTMGTQSTPGLAISK